MRGLERRLSRLEESIPLPLTAERFVARAQRHARRTGASYDAAVETLARDLTDNELASVATEFDQMLYGSDTAARFLENAFQAYRTVAKPGASLYVCHSSSWQREFQNALESAGFEVRCQIIWAKNTFAWGFGRYKFQHEPLFYAHVAQQKDAWYGDKSQSTLWEEKKPAANRIHPTAKPVELVERALLNSSKAGDIVADLFGGSGSTLTGCERRGRKARLMEIDPKYADCIVQRYQEYTERKAVLDGDGRTFEEIAEGRREGCA
jgi:DNA modification methylase